MDKLTPFEYEILMEAASLKEMDKDYRNHLQAFLSFAVKATRKSGKPVYSNFNKFYNYEKEARLRRKHKQSYNKKSRLPDLAKYLRKEGE